MTRDDPALRLSPGILLPATPGIRDELRVALDREIEHVRG
jgi:hypothetical protein